MCRTKPGPALREERLIALGGVVFLSRLGMAAVVWFGVAANSNCFDVPVRKTVTRWSAVASSLRDSG
jgi:hypothetical protein